MKRHGEPIVEIRAGDGKAVEWMEHVTDEQYLGAPVLNEETV